MSESDSELSDGQTASTKPAATAAPAAALTPTGAPALATATPWANMNNGALVFATPAFVAHPQLQGAANQQVAAQIQQQQQQHLQQQQLQQVVTRHQQTIASQPVTAKVEPEQPQELQQQHQQQQQQRLGAASPRLVGPSAAPAAATAIHEVREAPARRTNCGVCQGKRKVILMIVTALSSGPFAPPFARSLAPLTHSLASQALPARSAVLICLLAYSLTPELLGKSLN